MGSTDSSPSARQHSRPRTRGRTIIELSERPTGDWEATQLGVDVVGRGETPTRATIDYCERLEHREASSDVADGAATQSDRDIADCRHE